MTLDAIARGMTNIGKIAKVTKINNDAEIELIVNDLLTQRLIVKSEIRGFLGRKKTEIRITETGLRLLNIKKQELEQKLEHDGMIMEIGQSLSHLWILIEHGYL